MKTILCKSIFLISLLCGINSNAIAKGESTILLSAEKQNINLDFLNDDGITGLQFDITMEGVQQKSLTTSSCVAGVPKTHVGACKFVKNGNLRVIIFSPSNAVLESGNIGFINLTNGHANKIEISKVTMVRPDLKEINGEVLVDMGRVKPSLEDRKISNK